jgi:hypothetical protein
MRRGVRWRELWDGDGRGVGAELGGHRIRLPRFGKKRFIQHYLFDSAIAQRVQAKHPQLSEQDVALVMQGLRDYFMLCQRSKRRMVSMPSQVVDDAWHEFILFTRAYQDFCCQAFGRFLHHTPAEAMASPTQAQDGIKRAWRLACAHEGLDPKQPRDLPLLFAIDARLGIKDGFHYTINCRQPNTAGKPYCASHISCGGGCGGASGSSSSASNDQHDASGCGGGCGGD